jgi:uncharacterized protein with gpF-like domain
MSIISFFKELTQNQSARKKNPGSIPPTSLRIQTVDVFKSEPRLKKIVQEAIENLEVPWQCGQQQKSEAKAIALKAVISGATMKEYSSTLWPSIFKTKREAQHAMVKITSCANAAVSNYRMQELGLKKFRWDYLNSLCDFPEHANYAGKVFTFAIGANNSWPSTKYGCRCSAGAVFED